MEPSQVSNQCDSLRNVSAPITVNHLHVGERLLPLSFAVQAGEIVHLVGANGSGKSTLLAAMAGVLAHQGQVRIDHLNVSSASLGALARKRAYLSQSERPVFNIGVFQYLSLSVPQTVSIESPMVQEALAYLTHLMQIEDKLHRSIQQLSGGEWQRVRLVAMVLQVWRTLNPESTLLLLDEPAASLDVGQEALLYRLIQVVAEQGVSVVMANHDLNRTLRSADRVLLLDHGVLQAEGKAREVLTPARLSALFNTTVRCVEVDGEACLFFD